MEIIPAIDIIRGKVVRLVEGDFYFQTDYSKSPLAFAEHWSSFGIKMLHIVDLDGARSGTPKNLDIIKEIIQKVKISVEVGGGIRDERSLQEILDTGASRVVIGTMALDESFVEAIAKKYIKQVVVSIDAKGGMVQTKGWIDNMGIRAIDLAKTLKTVGFDRINYTDVARDGTMKGPNVSELKDFLKIAQMQVVAAGGVTTIGDIKNMKELEKDGLIGVIIGKALYEGRIDLSIALKIAVD